MKIITAKDFPITEKTAVAVGLFDGVHLGHIGLIRDITSQYGLKSAVYTFDAKPGTDGWIFSEKEKRSILESMGVDFYYSRPFDLEFANRTPERFLERMTAEMDVARLTVGFDFRFGKGAAGDVALLEQKKVKYGYELSVIPEVELDGEKVSSRQIRALVGAGDMERAARMMGRLYFADGRVENGARIGGKLGFPTANIRPQKLYPSYGVYATLTRAVGQLYRSVTNVGTKPTVDSSGATGIETFLIGFDGDLYGKEIRVYFVQKLRGEIKFANLAELKAQIGRDTAETERCLGDLEVYKPLVL